MPKKRVSLSLVTGSASLLLLLCFAASWTGLARISGATPGPYLAQVLKAPPQPTPTPTYTSTPPYGILLISEVMVHPGGNEPDGEWVELYNAGGAAINLSAYKLGDEETRGQGEGMFQFPVGASLDPGQTIVIAVKAASFHATYGFYPDFEISSSSPAVPDMRKYNAWASGSFSLVNTGDEVLVLNQRDDVIDSLSWGDSSWAFYPPCSSPASGASLERYPANLDTDTASDWREQFTPIPGEADITPPTSTPTQTPTRTPSRTPSPSYTASQTPTQSPVTTGSPTLTQENTLTPAQSYTPTQTPTQTPPASAEPSMTPTPSETPTASATLTLTPRVTPTGEWLLISEVLYDPAGSEPDSEWIELYNAGGITIDLASYKVGDEELQGDAEGMYIFPAGSTVQAGQVIIVAYRADIFTSTYGFYPDYEFIDSDPSVPNMIKYTTWSTGNINLNNQGDEVLVLGPDDQVGDAVSWGISNWAFDPDCPVVAEGHSIARVPANVDTDTAADWIDQPSPSPGVVELFRP